MDPNELEYTKMRQREMLSYAAAERDLRRVGQPHTTPQPENNLRTFLVNFANAARAFLF